MDQLSTLYSSRSQRGLENSTAAFDRIMSTPNRSGSFLIDSSQQSPYRNRSVTYPGNAEFITYSRSEKAFQGVVEHNARSNTAPAHFAQFDSDRLPQTDVLTLSNTNNVPVGKVSLKTTITPICYSMGVIENSEGKQLGTCTLINKKGNSALVIMARHSIEGEDIPKLYVTFGKLQTGQFPSDFQQGPTMNCFEVVENDAKADYAIVHIRGNIPENLQPVPLDTTGGINGTTALLHYPLGNTLKVSVHDSVEDIYDSLYVSTFHDSDYISSGGAYINTVGQMCALHLGTEDSDFAVEGNSLFRYAITLAKILELHPHSILGKCANNINLKDSDFESHETFLPFLPRNFLLDEEGRQSKNILTEICKDLKDKKIAYTKDKKVTLSKPNLKYIAKTYPDKFQAFLDRCLNQNGIHGSTREFSAVGYIESDHVIPYDVWKSTKNKGMSAIVAGKEKRPGENKMPAITIDYEMHRNLKTTGSSKNSKNFRAQIKNLCDLERVDLALISCFEEYKINGYNLVLNKATIENSIDYHINMNLIDKKKKKDILAALKI